MKILFFCSLYFTLTSFAAPATQHCVDCTNEIVSKGNVKGLNPAVQAANKLSIGAFNCSTTPLNQGGKITITSTTMPADTAPRNQAIVTDPDVYDFFVGAGLVAKSSASQSLQWTESNFFLNPIDNEDRIVANIGNAKWVAFQKSLEKAQATIGSIALSYYGNAATSIRNAIQLEEGNLSNQRIIFTGTEARPNKNWNSPVVFISSTCGTTKRNRVQVDFEKNKHMCKGLKGSVLLALYRLQYAPSERSLRLVPVGAKHIATSEKGDITIRCIDGKTELTALPVIGQ